MTTLVELKDTRARIFTAYLKAAEAQEYTIGDGAMARGVKRANFESLARELSRLDAEIARLETPLGARRVLYLR